MPLPDSSAPQSGASLPAGAPPPHRPARPLVAPVIVGLSVLATLGAHYQRQWVFDHLVATNLDVWLGYEWWTLLTSAFVHGGVPHLLFNGYWVWLLGRFVEPDIRPLGFAGLFAYTAWLGSAAEFAVTGHLGIGLSGVVYGIVGYMLEHRRDRPVYAAILNRQNIAVLLGWLVLCFPLTYAGVMNVANYAHLGGLVAGLLLGLATRQGARRSTARVAAAALLIASFVPLVHAPWLEEWSFAEVNRALERKDHDAALAALATIRRAHPQHPSARQVEVLLRIERGHYRIARELLVDWLRWQDDAAVRNSLAWLLATCPDDTIRDGPRALEHAQRAAKDTGSRNAAILDTLAAAHAEAGDFPAAVQHAEQAIALGDEAHGAGLREHLAAFRAGRAWREPGPPKDVSPAGQ